ncbi:hypothetical protein [Microcoleus sp. Pol7_A1]|uniref:hypothetical protein n=1 Tax=Microcoleus sp. Pol7_A1 TaxID=2818893 RepID=UPI002FD16087
MGATAFWELHRQLTSIHTSIMQRQGWYLLTNIGSLKQSIDTFKCRSGIEAMFKDYKTGGYNLERSHATNQRLSSLILLIALAYSCAIIQGQKIKKMGVQKYVGRVTECGRSIRRHSSFWIGLLASMLGNWNGMQVKILLLNQ